MGHPVVVCFPSLHHYAMEFTQNKEKKTWARHPLFCEWVECVCAKYDTTIMQDYDYLCTKTDGPTAIMWKLFTQKMSVDMHDGYLLPPKKSGWEVYDHMFHILSKVEIGLPQNIVFHLLDTLILHLEKRNHF